MFQRIEIIGNVGKSPEMRFTPSGQAVCNFSVAVNETYTNASGEKVKRTLWFRVQSWGKAAETHNEYVKKGMLVYVAGTLVADPKTGGPKVWESNGNHGAAFEINAREVKFLSRVEVEAAPDGVEQSAEDVPF